MMGGLWLVAGGSSSLFDYSEKLPGGRKRIAFGLQETSSLNAVPL